MTASVRAVALLALAVPIAALAQGGSTDAAPAGANPMASWDPRRPTATQEKASRHEVEAVLKKMEQANKKGDLDAATSIIDFPVLMLTDNKAGNAVGGPWSEEEWRKRMAPMFAHPMASMTMKHATKIAVLTPALASVTDDWTVTAGKTTKGGRSAMLLVKKDGAWKVKSMVEGGWGDMKPPEGAAAQQEEGGATK